MNGRIGTWLLAVASIAGVAFAGSTAWGCPGCEPTGLTLCDEARQMDLVVIGRLADLAQAASPEGAGPLQARKFEVVRVFQGDTQVRVGDTIDVLPAGSTSPGAQFLIMGIQGEPMLWSTPLEISERGADYIARLLNLTDPAARYRFVLDYLEDDEELLARDAYDELAKASYSALHAIKDELRRGELIARLADARVPTSRRRLYFVLLGIAGDERDAALLEEMMRSGDGSQRRGLDMLIFSYLALRGEAGLPLIEERFLRNPDCDYPDTQAAVSALRFHAAEGVTLKPSQVAASLRAVLDRPQVADLVIADLARWGDWSAIDKLFGLYQSAGEESNWVRVPIVNYLRACPLPRAKELIAACEKIDPQAVRRAHAFFPVVEGTPSVVKDDSAGDFKGRTRQFVSTTAPATVAVYEAPLPQAEPVAAAKITDDPPVDALPSEGAASRTAAAVNPGAAPAKALVATAPPAPNFWLLLGVPIMVGAALWVLQSSILRGRIGRG